MSPEQQKIAVQLLFDSMNEITGGPCQGLADEIQTFLNGLIINAIEEVN